MDRTADSCRWHSMEGATLFKFLMDLVADFGLESLSKQANKKKNTKYNLKTY